MSDEAKNREPLFRAVCCSGASNAGEFADKVTRLLDTAGAVNMNCLTKIAINDEQLIAKYKADPSRSIAIDGCPIHCAKKILEAVGIGGFTHVTVTDLGIQKGTTIVTQQEIERIAAAVRKVIY
jgi:uncharacterized metal-binding protein